MLSRCLQVVSSQTVCQRRFGPPKHHERRVALAPFGKNRPYSSRPLKDESRADLTHPFLPLLFQRQRGWTIGGRTILRARVIERDVLLDLPPGLRLRRHMPIAGSRLHLTFEL